MRLIKNLVVHCAATGPDLDIGVKEIDEWHRARGWSGVGYHYVIRHDGTIERGRPLEKVGAHVKGHNTYSIGICLVGGADDTGKPEANYTAAQYASLRLILDGLVRRFPDSNILGHCDFPGVAKACPSFDVNDWLGTLDDWRP